jgi:hypothetical protein
MPESESPVIEIVKPAACQCRAWECAQHAAASYFLVAADGEVLTHHPACEHAITEALSDGDFEVLTELDVVSELDADNQALTRELMRARAWASRWKALAKALHMELAATRGDLSDIEVDITDDFNDVTTPSSIQKIGRSSGLRLRSLLEDNHTRLNDVAAFADRKR